MKATSSSSSRAPRPFQPLEPDAIDLEHDQLVGLLLQTIQHFFGGVDRLFTGVSDPRDPRKIQYPLECLLFTGVLMFLCRLGSRRQVTHQFRNVRSIQKMQALFGIDRFPHGDTLGRTFAGIDVDEVQETVIDLIRRLVRAKVLDRYRLFGRFVIAIDATGTLSFDQRHCPYCLTATQGSKTRYFHNVLEAKLVTPDGFCFSMMSEFIENEGPNVSTQDCELRAFYRMVPRLKKAFPRLPLWLSLDGLYAGGPTFTHCEEANWNFTVVLKDGDLKLARRILDAWRYARQITRESLSRLLSQRIQIRFDTS